MFTLLLIGLAGGVVTSISPCVLPVLPVILASGAGQGTESSQWRFGRPVGVVTGLVTSFSLATLIGSMVLGALGLPQDLLRNIGIAVLLIIGLSLLVPLIGSLLERPFARLLPRNAKATGNGFVLGLSLGLLYVPCAGPVLATIAVVGATYRIGIDAAILTAAFGVGAGIPLLVLALAGTELIRRSAALRRRARGVRITAGVVMIAMALLIGFNLTDILQRQAPAFATALQNGLSKHSSQLDTLTSRRSAAHPTPSASSVSEPGQPRDLGGRCTVGGQSLENCGKAPAFTGVTGWLNTPNDAALTLNGLRGKVVLIDFWTYSCINCQRTLPHVEAWYRNYIEFGLVVVGVHTPEFAFERVRSNIESQAQSLGVKYPIAIDNNYGTWTAYQNKYWPAEYLMDAYGNIRHVSLGEGDYAGTELLIRQLLEQTHVGISLPSATDVPAALLNPIKTPETYLGYHYAPLHSDQAEQATPDTTTTYYFPSQLEGDRFALAGAWRSEAEGIVAGQRARLELDYQAHHVYLVLGGSGRVTVAIPGRVMRSIAVGGAPKLYTLVSSMGDARTVLTLSATPGVEAYDFTFG